VLDYAKRHDMGFKKGHGITQEKALNW
jgi:hypothetical protein